MRRACARQIGVLSILSGLWLGLMTTAPLQGQETQEQIGEVLGQPVYRDAIRTGQGIRVRDELHRLFTMPVLQKYREQHKAEIEPTEAEIEAAAAWFDQKHRERIQDEEPQLREKLKGVEEQLKRSDLSQEQRQKLEIDRRVLQAKLKTPGRNFALFVLHSWKFQKHLYDQYGGGRILWQQGGTEAFDATRKWLETLEKQGEFKISDPKLRTEFYRYWTTQNHGAFLTDDQEQIRSTFLEPEWMPKAPAKD